MITSTVAPEAVILSSCAAVASTSSASRPESGSSVMTSSGAPSRARLFTTRYCLPPDSWWG